MKVALVGATGKAGSRVLNELVNRGHQVTGIVRHPENVPKLDGVTAIGTDGSRELKITDALDWTFISPSRLFRAGERTGTFRYGKDHLLIDKEGNSKISFEDFALALVDELEQPKYIRQRFTVGY